MLQSNSNNNAQRLHAEWKKYYKNDEIIHKPLADMDTIYLETWALKKIEDYQFKRRQYNNMVTVIRQMLDYCQKKGLVEKNNFKSFTINNKKFVKAEKKINANEIFFKDEQTEVEALAYKDYEETGNVECLAVCLNFYLGLRLGELVTLKITDFNQSENFVKVERTEIKKYKKVGDEFVVDGTEVQEYLKCGKDERCVYYPDKVNSIVNIIIAATEEKGFTNMKYLFINKDGQRVGERAVDIRLRKYCKYAKINARGIHKTRKTYISTLLERGMSPNMVKEQAGHADIQTTFNNYYFSLTKDTEKAKQLNKIFDKME